MTRAICGMLAGVLALTCVGCGGGADRGANKDLDRPRAAATVR